MDRVAMYKLSAETMSRDQLDQLLVDFNHDFVRYDGSSILIPVPRNTSNQLVSFPNIDGLTDLIVQPLDGDIYVTLGSPSYNQRRLIKEGGAYTLLNAAPIAPTAALYLSNSTGFVVNVLVYFSGLLGVTPLPPPPLPPTGFIVGTFPITTDGFVVDPTGVANYIQGGPLIVLTLPDLDGVSNDTIFNIMGLPAELVPSAEEDYLARITDNDEDVVGIVKLSAGSQTLQVFSGFTGGEENPFLNVGGKGLKSITITYQQF